jgi:hypothetical protein
MGTESGRQKASADGYALLAMPNMHTQAATQQYESAVPGESSLAGPCAGVVALTSIVRT